jgi:hypothetical protein
MDKLTVVDMKDLAPQLMKVFQDAPKFACDIFRAEATKENGRNASFVDGWLEAHAKCKDISGQ